MMAQFVIAASSNSSHTENLINFLRPKNILLILDNCEHLLEACAQLTDILLKRCPNLKILATSREALGITGEAVYPVPSLALPDFQQLLENFRSYESVRLFEERAQLAQMDFSLTLENASSIAQICHRLDGIPLAIELAAAHVRMFSTEQISAQLNENFNILTGGSRTALPRQQTIRASIEWGWNLLSDSEQTLMQRLSIFEGGLTLEAAKSVCSRNEIETKQVLELMSQLVTKSLVVTNQESGRETRYPAGGSLRYHLLETIRGVDANVNRFDVLNHPTEYADVAHDGRVDPGRAPQGPPPLGHHQAQPPRGRPAADRRLVARARQPVPP
jgi:non-specific serine/threonine protein kinase